VAHSQYFSGFENVSVILEIVLLTYSPHQIHIFIAYLLIHIHIHVEFCEITFNVPVTGVVTYVWCVES
jgi:hypothetical protein